MPTLGIIQGDLWDLDTEEPLLTLSDVDMSDKEWVEQLLSIALESGDAIEYEDWVDMVTMQHLTGEDTHDE